MGTIQVEIIPENRRVKVEVSGKIRVLDLIHRLGFSTESVVIVKDEELLTEDEFLLEGEEVKAYLASSGG